MENFLKDILSKRRKKSISIYELEETMPQYANRAALSYALKKLIASGILLPDRQEHPCRFQINKQKLQADFWEEIRTKQLAWPKEMDLTWYFHHDQSIWQGEKKYLQQLADYLQQGLPEKEASIWARSYEISGDEKWLSDKRGKTLLKKLGLYEKMKLTALADPLMFSLNPAQMQDSVCLHLIIENKTTFYALAEVLPETDLLTIIYGAGKGILGNIMTLERQLHLEDRVHKLYYFGDLDWEGLKIWYLLNQRREAMVALPFYQALLQQEFAQGEKQQQVDVLAFQAFQAKLPEEAKEQLKELFTAGHFCPQEALSQEMLQEIVRETKWKDIGKRV